MLKAGYYALYKDVALASEGRRLRLLKRDWLVTDGIHIGRFDRDALDWVPLEWGNGQLVIMDEELSAQLQNAAVSTTFSRLELAFAQQLDTGDGSPVPDMPRPSIREGLGTYLTTRRNLTGSQISYSYQSLAQ
jgi:hypothetical protein